MSKLIEQVAKEIILRNDLHCFTSGDLFIIHEIYDECIKRGMKPNKNKHPLDILQRIRNGMKTRYFFNITVIPDSILKKLSIYMIKEKSNV